jgi:hypothetical protein
MAKTQSEMLGLSLKYSQGYTFDEVNKSAAYKANLGAGQITFSNLEAKKAQEALYVCLSTTHSMAGLRVSLCRLCCFGAANKNIFNSVNQSGRKLLKM